MKKIVILVVAFMISSITAFTAESPEITSEKKEPYQISFPDISSPLQCDSGNKTSKKATKKKGSSPKKGVVKAIKYDAGEIDLNSKQLPKNYQGNDIVKLFQGLNNRSHVTKGEFETTEQFNKRMESVKAKPIYGKLGTSNRYTFLVDSTNEYDADGNTMNIYVRNLGVNTKYHNLNTSVIGIDVKEIASCGYSYTGVNAFGASKSISYTEAKSVYLVLSNLYDEFNWRIHSDTTSDKYFEPNHKYFLSDIKFSLYNMPPDKAKALKEKLKFIIIFNLVEPYISTGEDFQPAEFDSSFSFKHYYYNFYGEIIEAWIYNFETGEILSKIKPNVQYKSVK